MRTPIPKMTPEFDLLIRNMVQRLELLEDRVPELEQELKEKEERIKKLESDTE